MMIKKGTREVIMFWGQRVFALYLAVFLLFYFIFDFKRAVAKAKAVSLSRLMPSDYTGLLSLENRALDKEEAGMLDGYMFYYEKLVGNMEYSSEGYNVLGFCYYQLGRLAEALRAYENAVKLEKRFFTFYHNLAVLYFKNGQYEKAAAACEKAFKTNLTENVKMLASSRVFIPYLGTFDENEANEILHARLREAYKNCYLIVINSKYHLKDFSGMRDYAREAISSALDKDGIFYYYAGMASYHLKDYGEAMGFLKEAIKINPLLADAYYVLGLTLKVFGENDYAFMALQEAARIRKMGTASLPDPSQFSLRLF